MRDTTWLLIRDINVQLYFLEHKIHLFGFKNRLQIGVRLMVSDTGKSGFPNTCLAASVRDTDSHSRNAYTYRSQQ